MDLEERQKKVMQSLSDRLCGAFGKQIEFIEALESLCEEFPLDYDVHHGYIPREEVENDT